MTSATSCWRRVGRLEFLGSGLDDAFLLLFGAWLRPEPARELPEHYEEDPLLQHTETVKAMLDRVGAKTSEVERAETSEGEVETPRTREVAKTSEAALAEAESKSPEAECSQAGTNPPDCQTADTQTSPRPPEIGTMEAGSAAKCAGSNSAEKNRSKPSDAVHLSVTTPVSNTSVTESGRRHPILTEPSRSHPVITEKSRSFQSATKTSRSHATSSELCRSQRNVTEPSQCQSKATEISQTIENATKPKIRHPSASETRRTPNKAEVSRNHPSATQRIPSKAGLNGINPNKTEMNRSDLNASETRRNPSGSESAPNSETRRTPNKAEENRIPPTLTQRTPKKAELNGNNPNAREKRRNPSKAENNLNGRETRRTPNEAESSRKHPHASETGRCDMSVIERLRWLRAQYVALERDAQAAQLGCSARNFEALCMRQKDLAGIEAELRLRLSATGVTTSSNVANSETSAKPSTVARLHDLAKPESVANSGPVKRRLSPMDVKGRKPCVAGLELRRARAPPSTTVR